MGCHRDARLELLSVHLDLDLAVDVVGVLDLALSGVGRPARLTAKGSITVSRKESSSEGACGTCGSSGVRRTPRKFDRRLALPGCFPRQGMSGSAHAGLERLPSLRSWGLAVQAAWSATLAIAVSSKSVADGPIVDGANQMLGFS